MTQYNSSYSVILPIYNGINFIDKCLEDHINQNHKPEILIIVDDGSSYDQKVSNYNINIRHK